MKTIFTDTMRVTVHEARVSDVMLVIDVLNEHADANTDVDAKVDYNVLLDNAATLIYALDRTTDIVTSDGDKLSFGDLSFTEAAEVLTVVIEVNESFFALLTTQGIKVTEILNKLVTK